MSSSQLVKDLQKVLSERVVQVGIDYTDPVYGLKAIEIQAVLLSGAVALIRMAGAIEAALDGELDVERAFNSTTGSAKMLLQLTTAFSHAVANS